MDPGQFLNFLVLQWFYNAKSVFLAVNASLRWLNNVSRIYLTQVSWFLIGQQHLASHWLADCANAITGGQQQIQSQLLLVQHKKQVIPFLSMYKYSPLVIRRNDKNKQLTIIKPTQTGINRNK